MSAIVLLPGEGKSVSAGPSIGETILKLFGVDTGGSFALVEHTIEPGAFPPPHIHHNEDEYSYVLEGEITVQVGEKVIPASAGTLVSKPRGISHTFWNSGSTTARFLEIISPAGLEKFYEEGAELFSTGGTPDRFRALAQKYNIELDMSRVPELMQKYHLKAPGVPGMTSM